MADKEMKEREDEGFEDQPIEEGEEDILVEDELPGDEIDEFGAEDETIPDETIQENAGTDVMLDVSTTDVPELEGMQVGDSLRVTADVTIDDIKDDGMYSLAVKGFIPAEKEAELQEPALDAGAGAPAEGGAPAGGGADLASLLGG